MGNWSGQRRQHKLIINYDQLLPCFLYLNRLLISFKTRCGLLKLICRLYTNLYGAYYMLGHEQRLPRPDYQLSAIAQFRTHQKHQLRDQRNGRQVAEASPSFHR